MPGSKLQIVKAVYYDPILGPEVGTDVTDELSSEVLNNQLTHNGSFNDIFPDHFKNVRKKLKIELIYRGKKYTQFYDEYQRMSLPLDLGSEDRNWWEKTWFQLIILGGAITGFVGLYYTFFKK